MNNSNKDILVDRILCLWVKMNFYFRWHKLIAFYIQRICSVSNDKSPTFQIVRYTMVETMGTYADKGLHHYRQQELPFNSDLKQIVVNNELTEDKYCVMAKYF